jgi:hypothetical protein
MASSLHLSGCGPVLSNGRSRTFGVTVTFLRRHRLETELPPLATQSAERLPLDLPDPLAAETDALGHFLERVRAVAPDAEP